MTNLTYDTSFYTHIGSKGHFFMNDSQRPTTKPNRLNFRLGDEKMKQFQAIMDATGYNRTEVFELLLDTYLHAAKIIRDNK